MSINPFDALIVVWSKFGLPRNKSGISRLPRDPSTGGPNGAEHAAASINLAASLNSRGMASQRHLHLAACRHTWVKGTMTKQPFLATAEPVLCQLPKKFALPCPPGQPVVDAAKGRFDRARHGLAADGLGEDRKGIGQLGLLNQFLVGVG